MADTDPELRSFITYGRERRDLEYKGAGGREPFAWESPAVKAKIAKTAMGMANIGGGTIVIGMDEVSPGAWQANGVDDAIAGAYQQDQVQEYVNRRADPYVELTVRHVEWQSRRFIIIQVEGFDEMPVVCTSGSEDLRQGAVYTRSRSRRETVAVQSQTEMREMLDRAIEVGVQKRLRPFLPFLEAIRVMGMVSPVPTDAERFEAQRGDL